MYTSAVAFAAKGSIRNVFKRALQKGANATQVAAEQVKKITIKETPPELQDQRPLLDFVNSKGIRVLQRENPSIPSDNVSIIGAGGYYVKKGAKGFPNVSDIKSVDPPKTDNVSRIANGKASWGKTGIFFKE